MKKFIIILFVLIIVAGLLWMFVFKNDRLNIGNVNNTETKQDVSVSNQSNVTTPIALETAQNNELYTVAVAEKNPDKCEDINKEDTKDRCFSRVAIETNQTDICQKIVDSSIKQSCLDDLIYQSAVSAENVSLCSAINDEFWKNSCLSKILEAKGNDLYICEELNDEDKILCNSIAYLKEAEETGDCSLLDESLKQECEQAQIEYVPVPDVELEEELVEVDSDNDGLSDNDEINIYNTDPNNADTDGDGYSDGEEVGNGYDPLS